MKHTVKVARIVMCVLVSFYTLYLCGHAGYSAYLKSFRMTVKGEGGYGLAWGDVVQNTVLDASVVLILLLLGATSVFLLFRSSCISAVGSALCAVAAVLFGSSLNTALSEFMFMRYQLGITEITVELVLAFKPLIACLCTCAAILYAVFFLITFYHSHRKENLS